MQSIARSGIQFGFLDTGPFDKPFENLRVLSNVEGLRVPSLSRDSRRYDECAASGGE